MSRPAGALRDQVAGDAVLVLAAGALVLGLLQPALPLPVIADLGGAARVALPTVAGRIAPLVPAAAAGALLLLRAGRAPGLLITGVAAPVVVFLVAQLNGIEDVGALVLTYACAAAAVLLRAAGSEGAWRSAAAVGIVPWGVIAFHQVGRLVAGSQPSAGVRITTLAVLAASVAECVVAWRARRHPLAAVAAPVVAALPATLLAVLTAAIV